MKRLAVAAAALLLAAAIAGGLTAVMLMGGDRLTKERYIAQADAICKQASGALAALGEPESLEDVATMAAAIKLQEDALAELRSLKPPEEGEATLNEAYDLRGERAEVGKQIKDAAEAGDVGAIQTLIAESDSLDEQADRIMRDYGLTECGTDYDRLSKEEYIAQADAICKATEDKLDQLAEPTTKEEFASFLEEGLALSEAQLDELRALNSPEADEATLEKAYSLVEQQLDVIREMVDAVEADDEAKVQELVTQGDALNVEADQIAADYGLKECGSN